MRTHVKKGGRAWMLGNTNPFKDGLCLSHCDFAMTNGLPEGVRCVWRDICKSLPAPAGPSGGATGVAAVGKAINPISMHWIRNL